MLSPDEAGIMLGLYSELYDWKKVRRSDGEAGEGWVNRARPYHSLPIRSQPMRIR